MKRFSVAFVFFIAFASVLALTKDEAKALAEDEAKEKFRQAKIKCNSDPATAVDGDAIKKWRDEGGEKPAKVGANAFCMSKAVGWQDENGNILRDTLKEKMYPVPENKANDILTKCAVDQPTKEETAEHLFKCFMSLMKERIAAGH